MDPEREKPLHSGMPNCLKKRRLLNEPELSPEICRDYGEKFLALGWIEDALEFFQKGNHQEGLEKIKALALETGDAFLLGRVLKNLDPELWRRAATQALAQGKLHFALRAYKLAGDEEKAGEISRLLRGEETLH